MPIYEYQFKHCGYQFEALQKMSDVALVDCPECHKPALFKKISAAAFRLSGSGWYETDFKSGKKKNLAGETEKTEATGQKKADKSTDSKNPKSSDSSSSDKSSTAKPKATATPKTP